MKLFICLVILVSATSPGLAAEETWFPTASGLVGQHLYDPDGQRLGTIEGITDETGRTAAIVSQQLGGGRDQVLVSLESILPRPDGGYKSVLDASSVKALPPYVPGRMFPGSVG